MPRSIRQSQNVWLVNQVQQQESGLDSPGARDGSRGLQPTVEGQAEEQHVEDGATKHAVIWKPEDRQCSVLTSGGGDVASTSPFIFLFGVVVTWYLKGLCLMRQGIAVLLRLVSNSSAQVILLAQSPGSWDYRHALPIHLDWTFKVFLNICADILGPWELELQGL